jgi:hypothetical protein
VIIAGRLATAMVRSGSACELLAGVEGLALLRNLYDGAEPTPEVAAADGYALWSGGGVARDLVSVAVAGASHATERDPARGGGGSVSVE